MPWFIKHRLESPASHEGDETQAASPAALATDEDQAAASTADDVTADPSTAIEDTSNTDDEPSFFDAIAEAAESASGDKKAEDGEDPDADDPDGDKAKAEADGADPEKAKAEDGESAEDNWEENVPFHKHPRWQQMVKERNEYRDQLQEFQPKAEQFQQIETFMESQDLTNQEVAQGFQIMALMKNDPAKALEQLQTHMESLQTFVGEKLPQDLQDEVDEGFITSDRAREIARLRNQGQFSANRAAQLEQKSQQQTQQQQVEQVQARQRSAVDAWQKDITTRDADFKTKQPFVFRELALLVSQTPPRNEQEAVALAKRAYETVNQQMKSLVPRKPEIKPSVNSDRASANRAAAPQPDSFMEAVMQAAESAR